MSELSFPYNKEILLYLNSVLQNDFWQTFVHIFSDGPIFFLPIFLVCMWIYWTTKKENTKKKNLLFIFYSTVLGVSINLIFQQFFHFERPEDICKITGSLIIEHIPDASFPSDHAAVSFAFLSALFLAGYKKTGLVFTIFIIAMNLSRIIGCVHWPYDILAGAIVGIISAIFIFKVATQWKWLNLLNNMIISLLNKIKL